MTSSSDPIIHATVKRQAASKTSPSQSPSDRAGDYLPEINLELVNLPSRSIPYPENSVVKYRPFAFGEVKKLSESKNMSLKDRFQEVLTGIETEGFDKWDLTLYDFLYIGLLRKISTLGSRELTAQYLCNRCRQKGNHKFVLADITFRDLQAPELPIVVDIWGIQGVEFQPPTVRDFIKLAEKNRHRDDISNIAVAVKNIDFNEAYKLIYNSDLQAVDILGEIDEYLNHDVLPIKTHCQTIIDDITKNICGNEIEISVSEEDTLIMPFRRDKQHASGRLRFGRETKH